MKATFNIILLSILVFSCSKMAKVELASANYTEFKKTIEVNSVGLIKIPLDSETGFRHRSIGVFKDGNREFLTFLNTINRHIYYYDLEAPEVNQTIKLERDGPNGVGGLNIAAHKFISRDSVILFNAMTANLYILNNNGQVIFKESLLDYKTDAREPNPEPSTMNPIIYHDNKVIMAGSFDSYLTDYSQSMSTIVYDIRKKELKFMIPLSEAYNQGYWGEQFKYNPTLDLDTSDNSILVNYPIDPFISKFDFNGTRIGKFYEVNSKIKNILPLKTDINYGVKKDHNVRDPEQYEYSLTNSDFRRVIYDPFRNLIYRIAYIRPTLDEFRMGKKLTNMAVSVLDNNFNKIGEKYFPATKYNPSSVVLSERGLLIARSDLYTQNENTLTFEIFEMR